MPAKNESPSRRAFCSIGVKGSGVPDGRRTAGGLETQGCPRYTLKQLAVQKLLVHRLQSMIPELPQ